MDTKKFFEIIMEGSTDFIKGFITGLIEGNCVDDEAFVGADYRIGKRGGYSFLMRYFSSKKNTCTVVAGYELKEALLSISGTHHEHTPFRIIEIHEIKSAHFDVLITTYSKETGTELKGIIQNMPIETSWVPKLDILEKYDAEGKGLEAYTPLHDYELRASGRIEGSVKGVFMLYHELKKYEVAELEEINLEYAEPS